ncbi:MAG: PaaI family thioesterase [bacterium]
MEPLEDDRHCFVCGEQNPNGLNLDWSLNEDESLLTTTFTPGKQFQGWKDVVHGGIIATILDEIMVNHGVFTGHPMVSVELSVRYRNPAHLNVPINFEGSVERKKNRFFTGHSECEQDGTIIAEANAKLMEIESELKQEWELN